MDADGTTGRGNNLAAVSNQGGIRIESASNTVGGAATADRNVISGNDGDGDSAGGVVLFGAAATGNRILGNYIGTDFNGTAALGNDGDGIRVINADNNTIGGTSTGARNVISGNNDDGIKLDNADGNVVLGNWIGQGATGAARANGDDGIDISGDSINNQSAAGTPARRTSSAPVAETG